jgi:hypothetical protein
METITKTVRVTIEKEYKIELPASFSEPEYIKEWSTSLWPIHDVDDIFRFAAEMAATDRVECNVDGLGRFTKHHSGTDRRSESTFEEIFSDIESWVSTDGT